MHADRTRETALWGWLRNGLKRLRPLRHDVQRIENCVALGTPDVEGCIEGDCFWCELKVAYPMAGERVRVKITDRQVRRAQRRERCGGRSWVLVRVCADHWTRHLHFLVRGRDAEELLQPIALTRLAELAAASPQLQADGLLKTMVGRS